MNKDLTVGRPSEVLRKFCLPLFGSVIFQQLYNIADSLVAGNFIGEEALAAVGNSYEITLIFIAVAAGCNIGCSVVTARLYGAGRHNDLKTAVYTSLISCAALCAVLVIAGVAAGAPLLDTINTPDDIFGDSLLYLNIYIFGLPFMFLYNISTGIFSALGDSKTPFLFLAASSLANIGADILFVQAFDMGVSGVAWATFMCQGVSGVLAVIFMLRRINLIKTDGRCRIFSLKLLSKTAAIAVPSIIQQSFISVGNIMIQSVINSFGSGVMAGYAASIKLNNLVITSLVTIGNGISNYTAQNIGANKISRIPEGYKAGVKLVWLICLPFVAAYVFFGRYLVYFFMDSPTASALNSGAEFLLIVSPFYFIISAKLVADGVLRGSGLMRYFMTSTFTDLVLRVSLAIILSRSLGSVGIWIAWPIGWAVSTVISVLFFAKKYRAADKLSDTR